MRKIFIIVILSIMWTSVSVPVIFGDEEHGTNVIVFCIDALRADHLGCYGYARNTSPHIDAFAEKSIIFKNAYTTIPSTSPALTTMFTSLYPSVHGIQHPSSLDDLSVSGQQLSDSVITLAEILKQNGYTTACYGPVLSFGIDRGFDIFEEEVNKPFSEHAIFSWLRENRKKKLFLYFHTYTAHAPYVSPYYDLFTNNEYRGAVPNTYDEWQEMGLRSDKYWDLVRNPEESDIQHLMDLYDGCIRAADENFNFLLQTLKKIDLLKNSIIIVTADHGEAFYEHGVLGHNGQLHVEQLHIPLIIKLPTNNTKVVENNVSLIDFTPTILDLLDITFKPALYEFQGESLVPMVKEEGRQRLFFAESLPLDSIAVKTSQWKYIERYQDGKRIYEELYDISIDEREGNDVISRYPEVVAEMRQKTGKFRGENKKLNDFLHKEITDTPFDEETVKRLKALGYI